MVGRGVGGTPPGERGEHICRRLIVQRVLSHLGMATEAPLLARARDPTDDVDDVEQPVQLRLGLA